MRRSQPRFVILINQKMLFTLPPELAERFPHLEVQQCRLGAEASCNLPKKRKHCEHVTGLNLRIKGKDQVVKSVTTDTVTSCSECPTARRH